jgi:hypothetical protein
MKMHRRNFLTLICCIPFAGVIEVVSSVLEKLDISHLKIHAPLWLFDEKSTGKVKALSLMKIDEQNYSFEYSEKGQVTMKGTTTVSFLENRNSNKPTKRSMLLKRTLSYALHELFREISSKRHKEKGGNLKLEFDGLQKEETIRDITIKSVYRLLQELNTMNTISTITWSVSEKEFIIQ